MMDNRRAGKPTGNTTASRTNRQFVTALARGLEVLAAFRVGDRLLGNQELAERTGMPKPTISRLTYTLTELNYLTSSRRHGKYGLSPRVLELGYTALACTGIRDIARPAMLQLAESGEFAVALGVRSKLEILYIEMCRRPEAVVLSIDVGARLPMAVTAIGRAYLAAVSERQRQRLLAQLSKQYPQDRERLEPGVQAAIAAYRECGYCTSLGEWRPEIHAVATAIPYLDPDDPLVMNIGGLASIVTRERIETDIAPRLLAAARSIQTQLAALV